MIRLIVSENVAGLRDRMYGHLPNVTQRNNALAKAMDTTLSQIQRIIAGSVGVSIDQIESLAKALECHPEHLLTPYFYRTLKTRRNTASIA